MFETQYNDEMAAEVRRLEAEQAGKSLRVGFVGLGIMGSAMAMNLLKAGHRLIVWNRAAEKADRLVTAGAERADSPREVAMQCEIVISMMADPKAVAAVRDGDNGILAGLGQGTDYLDMSTVDVATTLATQTLVQARGGTFLEAPVAGSRKPAEDATLTIMAAGDALLYEKALPLLQAMGKKVLYLGEAGNAARMKLANNLVMGGMLTAFCEGMALVSATGLDPVQFLDVLDAGAMSNPMFRMKGGAVAQNGAFPVAFPLKHMQKDLRLALRMAEEAGQPLFATATVNELFKKALAEGLGDDDFAAVSRVVRG